MESSRGSFAGRVGASGFLVLVLATALAAKAFATEPFVVCRPIDPPLPIGGEGSPRPRPVRGAPDHAVEAARFERDRRLPRGESRLPVGRYDEARARIATMPRHRPLPHDVKGVGLDVLSGWTYLGPSNVGGRTRAIVIDPNDPGVIYVGGVGGGVWKSSDGGNSWSLLDDGWRNLGVSALAITPTNSAVLYAGTGEIFAPDGLRGGGIYKTTDFGASWNRLATTCDLVDGLCTNQAFQYVADIAVSHLDPQRVYAATWSGIHRSENAGSTWTLVYDASSVGGCTDLEIRRDSPYGTDTLVGACGHGGNQGRIVRSFGGGTWTQVKTETNMGRTSVAYAPSNGNTIYAVSASRFGCTSDPRDGRCEGMEAVFRSTDQGTTWAARVRRTDPTLRNTLQLSDHTADWGLFCPIPQDLRSQGDYDQVIAVDPVDPNRVWIGGIDLMVSTDGGASWGWASNWAADPGTDTYVHADQHVIAFHPGYDGAGNREMYVGNDGGVFWTGNARAVPNTDPCDPGAAFDWLHLDNGLGISQFYGGAAYPGSGLYFGGMQDNGVWQGSDGAGPFAWAQTVLGDGGFCAVDRLSPNVIYTERNADSSGVQLLKSTNSGGSFFDADSGIAEDDSTAEFIPPFVIDPVTPNRLWFAGEKAWRTDNSAGSWTQACFTFAGYAGEKVSAIAVAPSAHDTVMVGTNVGNFNFLFNGGAANSSTSWNHVELPENGRISSIAFDPTDENVVWATVSTFGATHVWRSTDGGYGWAGRDGATAATSLPDIPFHTVAVDPAVPSRVWVGSDMGIFLTLDGGENWLRESSGFEFFPVNQLVVEGRWLFAFTHGRGAWRTPLPPTPKQTDLSVTVVPSSASVEVGVDVTVTAYPLTVGPDAAESAAADFPKPAGLAVVGQAPGCTDLGSLVRCGLGRVLPGVDPAFPWVTYRPTAAGAVGVTVVVFSSTYESDAPDNSATATITGVCTAPAAPVLVSPAHGASVCDSTPTLAWSGSAAKFDVWVDGVVACNDVTGNDCSPALANGTHTWFVEAFSSCGSSVYSAEARYVTVTAQTLTQPVLASPADGAVVCFSTTPNLTWSGNAATYDVYVDFVLTCDDVATTSCLAPVGPGEHWWLVIGTDACGATEWSTEFRSFYVSYVPAGGLGQAADADPVADTGVAVTWSGASDWRDDDYNTAGRGYRVWRDGSPISPWFPGTTYAWTDTSGQDNRSYHYDVQMVNGCGDSKFIGPNAYRADGVVRLLAQFRAADLEPTLADGDPVATWPDAALPGEDASTADAWRRPRFLEGRFGPNNKSAVRFDGVDDQLALSRVVSDAFTIAVVFRAVVGDGADVQWYGARGLVDGEVGGVTDDFGLSWNGRLLAGTGNPDVTVGSGPAWVDGEPHVAVMTRTLGGEVRLWVDGVLVESASGAGTQLLTAPSRLTIGSLQTNIGYFAGDIAEVRLYQGVPDANALATMMDGLLAEYGLVRYHRLEEAFDRNDNPNDDWTWGSTTGSGTPDFLPFDDYGPVGAALDQWRPHPAGPRGGHAVSIAHNTSDQTVPDGTPRIFPDLLTLHPGWGPEFSVARYEAPFAESVRLRGRFEGEDVVGTTTDVSIRRNGTLLWSTVVSGYRAVAGFSLDLALAPGDRIDFSVGPNGDWRWDSTGLEVSVHEPAPATTCWAAGAGMVSWWRGANGQDAIGGNHGTLAGGATTGSLGKVAGGFHLDGADDRVEIPDSPSLRPTSLTLEGWFQFTAPPTGIRQIVGKPTDTYTDSYGFWIQGGLLYSGIGLLGSFPPLLSAPFAPMLGTWYHIAYTFSDSGDWQVLYVNGLPVASGANAATPEYTAKPLVIGADYENGSLAFATPMRADEVALWNRALSEAEILGIVRAGASGRCPAGSDAVPGEAGTGGSFRLGKGAGTSVDATFANGSCAMDHAIYWGSSPGSIGTLAWSGVACALGRSGAASFDPGDPPAGGLSYFVVVGNNELKEGSYGKDSFGVERPEATGLPGCDIPQQLAGNGYRDCDGNPANGCETNTSSSPTSCGACGLVCPSGICSNGSCVP